jgi:zinc-ribbon domain
MSLTICPECGHEVSITATACPNCGHPFARPVIERKVVVADLPSDDGGFPKWAFIPLGILGIVLLFVLFVMMNRNSDDSANRTINVNVAARRDSAAETREIEQSRTVTVPPSTGSQTVTIPSSAPPTTTTSTTTVIPQSLPPSQTTVTTVPADKGTVKIQAKIASKNGAVQSVKNEKFYLLDKDLESILNDARIEPIEGQTLLNSFGMSVLFPARYGDFNRQALSAIKSHIKYSGTTDGGGTAQMKSIEPNSYYLFGVTKSGTGFAVWNSPVTIDNGQNVLNLTPQRLTEVNE